MEPSQPFNSFNEKAISCHSLDDRTFLRYYVPFGGIQTQCKNLISFSFWSSLKRRNFENVFVFFLICNISVLVDCSEVVETERVNVWPGESGTENHFTKVIVYPKCTDDSHCTGEQVCHYPLTGKQLLSGYHLNDRTLIGECRCPIGSVLWKWRCYLSVPKLGSHCVISRQCQIEVDPRRHCNPISRRCDCEPGHFEFRRRCIALETTTTASTTTTMSHELLHTTTVEETTTTTTTAATTTVANETNNNSHQLIIEKVLEKVNATLLKNQGDREGRYLDGNGTSFRGQGVFQWDPYRINTVAYIGLALLCVILLGIVSAFYARMMKDKRRSRAAIRSLLDLMSENRSMQSVYTMDGNNTNFNHNISNGHIVTNNEDNISNNNNNSSRPNPAADFVDPDCSSSSGDSLNYCDTMNCPRRSLGPILEDRIHLPPMEDSKFPKLPSPHLSAPVLPPIRRPVHENERQNRINSGISRPRPVPASKFIDGVDSKSPSPDAISAISQNLSEANHFMPILSAASFPDEDPIQIEPDRVLAKPVSSQLQPVSNRYEGDNVDIIENNDETIPPKSKLETQLILNSGYESDTAATFM